MMRWIFLILLLVLVSARADAQLLLMDVGGGGFGSGPSVPSHMITEAGVIMDTEGGDPMSVEH